MIPSDRVAGLRPGPITSTVTSMPTLLIVHHTPSPASQELFEAVLAGARDPDIEGVDVIVRPALTAPAPTPRLTDSLRRY